MGQPTTSTSASNNGVSSYQNTISIHSEQGSKKTVDTKIPLAVKKNPKKKKHKHDIVFKKAPGAPKRFKSSYVHFFNHFVERKKKEIGSDGLPLKIKIAELSSECSKIWKTVSTEHKKYWEGVSNKDKEEYLKKKDDYKGPWRVVKGKKKDPNAPKRSPSAFFLFVNERHLELKDEYPHLTHRQIIQKLGGMWKKLPADEQAPFRGREETLRRRYKIDTEKWKAGEEQRKRNGGEGVEAQYKAYDDVRNDGDDHTRRHSPQPKPEVVYPKESSLGNHSPHYYSQDPYHSDYHYPPRTVENTRHSSQPNPEVVSPKESSLSNHPPHYYSQDQYHWDYHYPPRTVESTVPLSYYEPSRCDNKSVPVTTGLSYEHYAVQVPHSDRLAFSNVSFKANPPYHHYHSSNWQNNATHENNSAYLHARNSYLSSRYDHIPEQTSTISTAENRYNVHPTVHMPVQNQQSFKEDNKGQCGLEKRSTMRNQGVELLDLVPLPYQHNERHL